jgi:hypothetical protein
VKRHNDSNAPPSSVALALLSGRRSITSITR